MKRRFMIGVLAPARSPTSASRRMNLRSDAVESLRSENAIGALAPARSPTSASRRMNLRSDPVESLRSENAFESLTAPAPPGNHAQDEEEARQGDHRGQEGALHLAARQQHSLIFGFTRTDR